MFEFLSSATTNDATKNDGTNDSLVSFSPHNSALIFLCEFHFEETSHPRKDTSAEMAHIHSMPHHGSTATSHVVSHTESDFDQLLVVVEVSPREFDEDIEFEGCLRYLEHVMAGEDEEDWEDAFMHLLEDELPSTTARTTTTGASSWYPASGKCEHSCFYR